MVKKLFKYLLISTFLVCLFSCQSEDDKAVANNVTLVFKNTFKDKEIVLGDANSQTATTNISAEGQVHHFSELKYVISNIQLVKADGNVIPYNINDLDKGATVINQAKESTLKYVLNNIPAGDYKQIKLGLGIKSGLNRLDQMRFPKFYESAGANDTKMHWEWGTGYRFTKIEGFFDTDNEPLSIHTGSTVVGENGDPSTYTQGKDAYREIVLNLTEHAVVGKSSPTITIKADFDKLLTGKINTVKLGEGNSTPSVHTALNMMKFVDNLGGNGINDITGVFSILKVEN